jgi:hypothetical protein
VPSTARQKRPSEDTHRFLLRLPADLHRRLVADARQAGLSLNEYCVRRLAETSAGLAVDAAPMLAHARRVVGPGVIGAMLHGSSARGETRDTSDVDLLLVVDRSVALSRALYAAWDDNPPQLAERPLDVHFVHCPADGRAPGALWCEAALEGVILADRDGTIAQTLRDVRRAIAEGRVVRRSAHGQPYWTTAA